MDRIEFSNGAVAIPTELEDCYVIKPRFFGDERGYYVADHVKEYVEQVNFGSVSEHTESKSSKNVLRKMTLDVNGCTQGRIVRCVTGDAIDIIIDARKDSKTFGKYTLVHLSPYDSKDELKGKEVCIPAGFVHGVLSLKDDTCVQEFIDNTDTTNKEVLLSEDEIDKMFESILFELGAGEEKITIVHNKKTSSAPEIIKTYLQDCYIVEPNYVLDDCGYTVTDFNREEIERLGFEEVYQHSESKSSKNVLRGLHFQLDPKCQAKLVRVVSGEVIDVVVDIRVSSPTYGKAIAVHLTPYDPNDPSSGKELYVPRGFAHGFVCLTDDVVFQYFVDNRYTPELEEGILWSGRETAYLFDDVFKEYGIDVDELIISAKDKARLPLEDKPKYFDYNAKKKMLGYSFEVGV